MLALGLRGAFADLRRRMDYAEYGGAPLLGVNGVCIAAHGRSTPYAMQHALRVAREGVDHHVLDRLRESIASVTQSSRSGSSTGGAGLSPRRPL
jgi:glycerol-3-phosphate acyltransferase PlsX